MSKFPAVCCMGIPTLKALKCSFRSVQSHCNAKKNSIRLAKTYSQFLPLKIFGCWNVINLQNKGVLLKLKYPCATLTLAEFNCAHSMSDMTLICDWEVNTSSECTTAACDPWAFIDVKGRLTSIQLSNS